MREFVPRLRDYPHDTILEIGCGFGRMSIFIAAYCTRFYGVDISGSLILQAMGRLAEYRAEFGTDGVARHGTFIEVDGQTVEPIEDGVVDLAYEYLVFQHIPVEDVIISYIRDVHRVLKPGGVFIMHGRDVLITGMGSTLGNTWHGCRCGQELVYRAMDGTSFSIIEEEGVGTERYWVTLQKR
jgi:SAM-dependent methyltransferase